MNNNLKDILSHLNKDIEQDKLLEYLNNQLSDKDQHEVEVALNDDEFTSDAMDGLQPMQNKTALPGMINQLNSGLKKQLKKRKERITKSAFADQRWVYFAIILLLILILVAYIIIKKISS